MPSAGGLAAAHVALARALESAQPGSPDAPLRIAQHYAEAEEWTEFVRTAVAGAQYARSVGDYVVERDVLELLLQHLSPADEVFHAEVLRLSARSHRWAGDVPMALSRAEEALALHGDPFVLAAAVLERAGALTELEDPRAKSAADEALRAALALPDSPRSTSLLAMSSGLAVLWGDGLEVTRAVMERAESWGLSDAQSRAATTLGTGLALIDPEAAREALQVGERLARELVGIDPTLLVRSAANGSWARLVAGDHEGAIALAYEGLDVAGKTGLRETSGAHLAAAAVEALIAAGRPSGAERLLAAWLPDASAHREREWLALLDGRVGLLVGDIARAQRASGLATAGGPGSTASAAALLRVELAERTREPRAMARLALAECAALSDSDGFAILQLLGMATLGAARAAADESLQAALEHSWRRLPPLHPVISHRWRTLAAGLAKPEGATPRVVADSFGPGAPAAWRVRVRLAMAEVELAAGRLQAAKALVTEASDVIDHGGLEGFRPDLTHLRARLQSAGTNGTLSLERLTPRQLDIVRLIASGESNGEIATSLGVSVRTVEVHVSAILRKLSAPNRGAAVSVALRMGLIDADDVGMTMSP